MTKVKNEHIVWAYGKDGEGREVIIIGLTATGLQYLKSDPGNTLLAQPPAGIKFADVSHVVVFHEQTKEHIKATLRKSGLVISEVN